MKNNTTHVTERPHLFLILIVFVFLGCSKNDNNSETLTTNTTAPNILFIIADDLGKDAISGFSEGSIKPSTPNIDAIRTNGLSFTNFWAYPTCSPTRASILTGKYGYRTGVKWAGDVLSTTELSLQDYIKKQTNSKYATALVGKWHLSGSSDTFNPEVFGIDYYAGFLRGEVENYYSWTMSENGSSKVVTDYATTKFTDLAIDWIGTQSKPWFMWLAYNAPHTPFHVPPSNMHKQGNLPEYKDGMDAAPYYMAAIEAMDFQIGQLLATMSEAQKANTIIIFIGDNGTPNEVAQSPYSSKTAKGTVYQGGINVPMFISGKGVSRNGTENNLVSSTDLFATIAQIAGSTTTQINDSTSFLSLLSQSSATRSYQYAEKNNGTIDTWTISNGSYKLIQYTTGVNELYYLVSDPYELNNLIKGTLTSAQTSAKTALEAELSIIRK
ncbi:sulfatase [Flavobacterium faecale]|uniref:Sulfatase n=1 Tax=Flavobacterium faecale TaxID=1355330 RepID=A0A2S1LG89_9FLAO|nr:sulfatase-like hydrolase/transferase [Flavobacterium faecale]AWG22729.1 sulfatase [Flavobacterium faecale]